VTRPLCETPGLAAPPVVGVRERRELAMALGEPFLGRSQLRPLLLELRLDGLCTLLELHRRVRLGVVICRRLHGVDRAQHGPETAALRLVAALDLGAEAGAEARLRHQLDPILRGEGVRELRAGDEAALDERLAEPPAGLLLLCER
jgi:hypothetical protein